MLKVIKSGFFTTVQDRGRFGFRHMGVPVSGSMDQAAASLANDLLENEENAAVLEITMSGPHLEFEEGTWIAISGANLSPQMNGKDIDNHSVHKVNAGDKLTFGKHIDGLRGYLAVKNGFQTPVVLNSRSFYSPITEVDHLTSRMEVPYDNVVDFEPKITHIKRADIDKYNTLNVSPGPEFDILSDAQKELILNNSFTIAKENNRMAYQLEESIGEHKHTMLTSATLPGTVQVTPGGKLIILMRDGQTTG
ncbi:MAG: biotin-dependent carboxyltransferase family protein, partial [Eudoraea sp.]|nr:biotin-dependent carboxyltransferase family protein [Eudoraea sp.]